MKLFSEHDDYYFKHGLDRDPFPKDGIDNIVFTSPELNQRIELIKHLLEFSQQLVVVTTPSGGGKTTLALLLMGLLNPREGRVTCDGWDIKRHLTAWHSQIGYVGQAPFMAARSVRENVAFGLRPEQI